MKQLPILALSILALASGARADDPPTKPAAPPASSTPAAPTKHENKITPEAKAAFETMEKAVNGPLHRGMKEASGTISAELPQIGASTMKFTVTAPEAIKVESDPNLQGQLETAGKGLGRAGEIVLGFSLGAYHPSDEYDAETAKKDGKDLLVLTTYKDGVQQSRTEFTLDANGLIASGSWARTRDGQKVEMKGETTYTWSKNGDSYRVDKIETTSQSGRGGGGKTTLDIVYADANGFSFPVSWKSQNPRATVEMRVSELVVDGKKVEIKAPPKAVKHEKGEEGEDDEDEGKEKGGKK